MQIKRRKTVRFVRQLAKFSNKTFKKFIFTIIPVSLITCVSSPAAFKEMDRSVEQADFITAIKAIEQGQEGKNAIYSAGNAISLYIDKGLLEHYAGNYEASSADLQFAESLIEASYTKSITEGFFSYIINDNAKEYPGEDFEDIYINVFNALNYYKRSDMESALVEIRKLSISSGKLDMLARKYEYADPKTGASLNEAAGKETGINQMPQTKAVNFSNSALARFLGALFYLGSGKTDDARIEFDEIYRAFSANKTVYSHPVPAAVEQARNVPQGKARLNVISFTGLSVVKQEERIVFPLPFRHPVLQIASFKLPVLKKRLGLITKVEVVIDGNRLTLELLEDMNAVIEETFSARYSNVLLKTFIRTILKYSVADIAAVETTQQQGQGAGMLVAVAARAALELSEGADTRMSRYLPGNAFIGGINLDPGTYSVIINYYQGNTIIAKEEYKNVNVSPDTLNLLETINLK